MWKGNKRGNLIAKGVTLAIFLFLVIFVPSLLVMVQYEMQTTLNDTYGEGSAPMVVANNGVNSSVRFSNQVPAAASIGGIVIIILLVAFAVGDFMSKRNQNQGGGSTGGNQGFDLGGGFGG